MLLWLAQVAPSSPEISGGTAIALLGIAIGWVAGVTALFYRHLTTSAKDADARHQTELKDERDRTAQLIRDLREEYRSDKGELTGRILDLSKQLEFARNALLEQTKATAETNAVNAETNKMLVDIVDRAFVTAGPASKPEPPARNRSGGDR